jgi:hypothetical protein
MLWIVGLVLVLAGVGLFAASSSQRRKLGVMQGTQTSSAAELASLAQSVAREIGAGSFAEVAELKGTVRCSSPLTSELSSTPCVHYSMRVTREYEETTVDTDAKGNQTPREQRGSETVAQNTRSCAFEVEDATGTIAVDPAGAAITGEKVLERFEQGEPRSPTLTIGRWRLDLGSLARGGGRRTVGFRYEETIVPLGKPVYVLGEASDAGGSLAVRKPAKKGGPFIVSVKSEEELTRSAAGANRGLSIAAAVAGAAGLIVAVLDLLGII